MDVAVDMVDPVQRNEVMLPAGLGVVLGQLDLVLAFDVIDGSDMLAIRAEYFHVFLDGLGSVHRSSPWLLNMPPAVTEPPITPAVPSTELPAAGRRKWGGGAVASDDSEAIPRRTLTPAGLSCHVAAP